MHKNKNKFIQQNFNEFQKLAKNKYCGHSILSLEYICEVENKYYP